MTSTSVFYGTGSTLTVHMPPGTSEAVLMIEGLDNVASITLKIDEVRNLLVTLQRCAQQDPGGEGLDHAAPHEISL